MNNAPFYIGQKVVSLRTSWDEVLKKGDVVTVANMDQCACGRWAVHVLELPVTWSTDASIRTCPDCGKNQDLLSYRSGSAKHFAPLQSSRIEIIRIAEVIHEQAEVMVNVYEKLS